ncbi:MAG TPA: AAA family ATPase [Labilithrix sp.]|nr:AAA family ATPase [Labilithrix sp.]
MLIGRGRELAGLDEMLTRASQGRGSMRVVSGEAGVGKTRLADEAAERAAGLGFRVSWGRAWETGGAPTYWPWTEALRATAEESDLPPALRGLVGDARAAAIEGTRADPASDRFELFDAVATFLRSSAKRGPLLIVLDDLHAADLPTLELLAFVARGLRTARTAIAIVATWRDAEARVMPRAEVITRIAREAEMIALKPLSNEDVAEVVRHELGRFDAVLAGALFELTDGNPLFLHETLHALSAHRGDLDSLRDVAVTGGVGAVVRQRLAGACEELRPLLELAATFGREIPLDSFAAAAERSVDAARSALEEATTRGLLLRRSEDRWAFSHVLVREAFYRELTTDRRRVLHATIAAALQRGRTQEPTQGQPSDDGDRRSIQANTALATLAHHQLAAAPDVDPRIAVRTAHAAADRARAQLAYEEAQALLERALAACETFGVAAEHRAEIVLALGWACTEAGGFERGRALFREATAIARRLGDAKLLARAALGQGGQYVLAEIRSELVEVLQEALAALGDREDTDVVRLRARVLARLAAALTPSSVPEEPLALARQALAMTETETDPRTRIDVGVGVGAALGDFARPAERISVNERLLRDARTGNDRVLELRALTRLGCDHLERGDVASSAAAIDLRAALADSLGHARYRWQTPLLRSMHAMVEGRFDDCEVLIRTARTLASECGDPNAERCVAMHRFCMLFFAGRGEELRQQLPETIRATDALPDGVTIRHWMTAMTGIRTGENERAADALRALGTGKVMTARLSRALLAECAVACGARDLVGWLYASFEPDEDAMTAFGPFAFVCGPPIACTLAQAAYVLGRVDEARALAERGLAIAKAMIAPAPEVWAHLVLGEVSGKRESLLLAKEGADRFGMGVVAARARAALGTATSAPPPARSPMTFALAKDGSDWVVTSATASFRVKDVRGMAMIARLVTNAGRELHAIDVATDFASGEAIDLGDAGEVLDARAKDAYKARIKDLREDLEEAEARNDAGTATRLRAELEALTSQIAGAIGLGGRERRSGAAAERARVTVQRRIREAIRKIGEQDADLGRYLDWTIRTGTFCAYEPEGRRKTPS